MSNPSFPYGSFTVGIDANTNNGTKTLQQVISGLRSVFGSCGRGGKFFDGGKGWQTAVNNLLATDYGTAAGEAIPVICSKKHDLASFKTAIGQALARFPVVVCILDQEYDDEMRTAGSTTTYRTAITQFAADRDQLGWQGKALVGASANVYVELVAPGNPPVTFESMYAGLPIELMGFDAYDDSFQGTDFVGYVQKCQAFANQHHFPWALTEFGAQVSTKVMGDTIQAVANRVQAVINVCKADPSCCWANYWPQPAGSATPGEIPLVGTPVEAVIKGAMS